MKLVRRDHLDRFRLCDQGALQWIQFVQSQNYLLTWPGRLTVIAVLNYGTQEDAFTLTDDKLSLDVTQRRLPTNGQQSYKF